jgi:DNA-binding MarR family transcriptional regulator
MAMAGPSDPRLLVLHGLRLKGFAEPDDVAALVGLEPADVVARLEQLEADELVLYREGRLTGWALTPAGRKAQEQGLQAELQECDARDAVLDAYKRFLDLNNDLLGICTAWQMKDEATINDHADPAYDKSVIDRLHELHGKVEPIITDLEATLDRYCGYRSRLQASLARLRSGEAEWFTKPLIDSYHTVWFQLHEDLLNTLGIERSQEGAH